MRRFDQTTHFGLGHHKLQRNCFLLLVTSQLYKIEFYMFGMTMFLTGHNSYELMLALEQVCNSGKEHGKGKIKRESVTSTRILYPGRT